MPRPGSSRIESLAVLPLDNLSGDAGQDYFADGMTEVLITDLGKIGSLRVISRPSVMRYKGSRSALLDIAKELKVDDSLWSARRTSSDCGLPWMGAASLCTVTDCSPGG